jgi:hypothetical protein
MQRHGTAIERARIRLSSNASRRRLDLAAGPVPGILKFRQAAGGAFNRATRAVSALSDAVILSEGRRCGRSRAPGICLRLWGDESKDVHFAIEV